MQDMQRETWCLDPVEKFRLANECWSQHKGFSDKQPEVEVRGCRGLPPKDKKR